jgi:thymidylate synthase ThyX
MPALSAFDHHICALRVWDGGDVHIPGPLLPENPEIGDADAEYQWALNEVARAGKMQGTVAERLSEVAGRACYDSLAGKGRGSEEYHKHIAQVNHTSVWGHFNATHVFARGSGVGFPEAAVACLHRPGVWCLPSTLGPRITANLRAVYEWDKVSHDMLNDCAALLPYESAMARIGALLQAKYSILAPRIIPSTSTVNYADAEAHVLPVSPDAREEKWITVYISGSRGLTHELVRHGWRTGMSQRSTRFCDETETPWVKHPVITAYEHADVNRAAFDPVDGDAASRLVTASQKLYAACVDDLQDYLTLAGSDKLTARKQARGAARGYLGNALFTEIIFSASVAQWRRILIQRCHPAADAEIRVMTARLLPVLKASRYAEDFADMVLVDSPDVLGPHLAGA